MYKKAFTSILLLTLIVFLITHLLNRLNSESNISKSNSISESYISKSDSISDKTFQIFLWTKWFGLDDWKHFELNDKRCRFSNCILTSDNHHFNNSDAIVFHWYNLDPNNIPKYKLPHQKWILHNMEPPVYTPLNKILNINDLFDWTMGYRKDADIYAPYGRINKCFNNNWKQKFSFEDKSKDIVWLVSNCKTDNEREKYAEKLRQYIDVDIYGRCGSSCPRFTSNCNDFVQRTYKFYLAFENSLCKDYVTEKIYFYMGFDLIPVVMGSVDYKSLLPYNSYIDVFNFSSPKNLSLYLKEVGSDENKYNSYFNWKKDLCIEETDKLFFCELCEKLNKEYVKSTTPIIRNLTDWWTKEANCQKISQLYDLN